MKKLLALILSVIMLLSVMPVAYAERVIFSPEVEQYIDIMVKLNSYIYNVYDAYDNEDYISEELENLIQKVVKGTKYENVDFSFYIQALSYDCIMDNLDRYNISEVNELMLLLIDEVDSRIESGEFKVIINTYEMFLLVSKVVCYYNTGIFACQ